MRKRVTKDEQIKFIVECRKSGLSDYQWCKKNEISPGTFYNWVSKLRKSGYAIPDSACVETAKPMLQEVVKVDLIEKVPPILSSETEQNTRILTSPVSPTVAAEVIIGSHTLRLYNGASKELIQTLFACMGGGTNAW